MPTAPPRYEVIARQLAREIESGRLPAGTQLPVELELVKRFEASRNTVRKAIALLTTRRLVESRQGQGTFVVKPPAPYITTLTGDPGGVGDDEMFRVEVARAGRKPSTDSLRVETRVAGRVIAAALQIDADDDVVLRAEQRFIDGTPWSLETSYYPMSLVERGAWELTRARNIPRGTVAYLMETLGIKQAAYRDSICARLPSEAETAFFGLPLDGRIAVFEISRTAFGEDRIPFRLTVTVYPADRNRFIVNLGDPPQGRP